MPTEVRGRGVKSWAGRILRYEGEEAYRRLLAELSSDPVAASALLDELTHYRNPTVRAWAGTAARTLFGPDATPLLLRLVKDANADVRNVARQDLEEIDPALIQAQVPSLRRVLKRGKDPWGEDREAMWRLAGMRDAESISLLRAYGDGYDHRYYHYRMPNVLADYIEDPSSLCRRIRAHDHDWMFWLVEAARLLPVPEATEAFADALASPLDPECAKIVRDATASGEGREAPEFVWDRIDRGHGRVDYVLRALDDGPGRGRST